MSEEKEVFQPGDRIGDYEVVSVLGFGATGTVYLAQHAALKKLFAVKVLSGELAFMPEFVTVFRHEAQIVAALSHENIVPVHNFGEWNGLYYYVMDFVKGGTLEDVRRRNGGRLRPDAAMDLIVAVARGLAYAHAYGVVHRDLKPENILLTHTGTPQITDFGMAFVDRKFIEGRRRLEARRPRGIPKFRVGRASAAPADVASSQTQIAIEENAGDKPEVVGGTEGYIAPEVERGNAATPRADVYALGALLHFLLVGETPPEPGRLSPEIYKLHRGGLAELLLRALSPAPTQRFPTAKEFLAALERVRWAPVRRRRRFLLLLAAALTAGALAFAFSSGKRSQLRKNETRIAEAQKIFEAGAPSPVSPAVSAGAAASVRAGNLSGGESRAGAIAAGAVSSAGAPSNAAEEREYWERLCAGRTGRRAFSFDFLESGYPLRELSAANPVEFFYPVPAGVYNVYLRTDGNAPAASVPVRISIGEDQISRVVRFDGNETESEAQFFSVMEVSVPSNKIRIEIPDTHADGVPAVGLLEIEFRPTFSNADFSRMFGEFLSALGEK